MKQIMVASPLDAINAASVREKGPSSTVIRPRPPSARNMSGGSIRAAHRQSVLDARGISRRNHPRILIVDMCAGASAVTSACGGARTVLRTTAVQFEHLI